MAMRPLYQNRVRFYPAARKPATSGPLPQRLKSRARKTAQALADIFLPMAMPRLQAGVTCPAGRLRRRLVRWTGLR